MLILHGARDPAVRASEGRKAFSRLSWERASPYGTFEGLGHGISEESIRDAASWLRERLDE